MILEGKLIEIKDNTLVVDMAPETREYLIKKKKEFSPRYKICPTNMGANLCKIKFGSRWNVKSYFSKLKVNQVILEDLLGHFVCIKVEIKPYSFPKNNDTLAGWSIKLREIWSADN